MAGKKNVTGKLGQSYPSDDVGRKQVKPNNQAQGKIPNGVGGGAGAKGGHQALAKNPLGGSLAGGAHQPQPEAHEGTASVTR